MANQILTGQSFGTNDNVTNIKLMNIASQATLLPGAITEQAALAGSIASSDSIIIHDDSTSSLRKITAGDLLSSALIGSGPIGSSTASSGKFTTLESTGNASLKSLSLNGVALNMVGMVAAFAKTTAPAGWLICNGQSLLRTGTYADLFSVIGTSFGSLDSTHFYLPNLLGVFVRGWNSASTGYDPSRAFGTTQLDAFESHTHSYTKVYNEDNTFSAGSNRTGFTSDDTFQTGTPSAGSGTETRPVNMALLYCIKY